jgi:mRNA interferase MazF
MPIHFLPRQATVLICDFSTGFIPPEMVKRRPVIIISPRLHERRGPHLVVPLSNTRPDEILAHHVRLRAGRYSFLRPGVDSWVKCNLIAAVAPVRLDRLRQGRHWIAPMIDRADFEAVQLGVLHALALQHLTRVR